MNKAYKRASIEERAICLFELAKDWQDTKLSDSEFVREVKRNIDIWTTGDMLYDDK